MTLSNASKSKLPFGAGGHCGRQSGFMLVEALVGLSILAVGLLGLTGLQMVGMRNNHDSYLRSQAILQADDILDRMRANRANAVSGLYNIALGATPGSGLPTAVMNDLAQWKGTLNSFPGPGDGSISVNGRVVTITLQWDESRDGSGVWTQFQTQSQL